MRKERYLCHQVVRSYLCMCPSLSSQGDDKHDGKTQYCGPQFVECPHRYYLRMWNLTTSLTAVSAAADFVPWCTYVATPVCWLIGCKVNKERPNPLTTSFLAANQSRQVVAWPISQKQGVTSTNDLAPHPVFVAVIPKTSSRTLADSKWGRRIRDEY